MSYGSFKAYMNNVNAKQDMKEAMEERARISKANKFCFEDEAWKDAADDLIRLFDAYMETEPFTEYEIWADFVEEHYEFGDIHHYVASCLHRYFMFRIIEYNEKNRPLKQAKLELNRLCKEKHFGSVQEFIKYVLDSYPDAAPGQDDPDASLFYQKHKHIDMHVQAALTMWRYYDTLIRHQDDE